MKEVSASILSKKNIFKLIDDLNKSNTDYIHLDIMDNKFVPNKFLTVGETLKVLDKITKKIDAHLMVENPELYIKKMALYNVSYITVHFEIKDYKKYIDMIKNYGFKAGISIKPKTPVEAIYDLLNDISVVLIMSVEPGLSGQEFIPSTKEKIDKLRSEIKRRNLNVKISVDGGINNQVLDYVKNADILVSCSYVLEDYNNIDILKNA
ncbi:MAG TPA: ribulose-phosphate 3-epimerase [Bacilli bacterium]|nr:ribulose-phosphate 3-epimerase [Bacilli bacterium]